MLADLGTFLHPSGEVRRSIFFKHQGAVEQLMMITLSETHLAMTDLSDLNRPERLSEVEVAPFVRGLFRLGGYLVEAVSPQNPYDYGYYSSQPQRTEFRVKRSDAASVEEAPVLASFSEGGVAQVMVHGNKLVLFRVASTSYGYGGGAPDLLVYDLANPLQPRRAGSVQLPSASTTTGGAGEAGPARAWPSSSYGGSWVPTASGLVALQSGGSWYGEARHDASLRRPRRARPALAGELHHRTRPRPSRPGACPDQRLGVFRAGGCRRRA